MQTPAGVPRGALYVLSGVVSVAACYFTYQHFLQVPDKSPAEATLRRSNAVRRRRRRWRDGYRPLDLDHDPTTLALEHLKTREASGDGYGMYLNHYYVNEQLLQSHGQELILLPSRLRHIHTTIAQGQGHTLSPVVSDQLMMHIQARFIQNFLLQEYPEGYLVSQDTGELYAALAPAIDHGLLQGALEVHDQGDEIVDADIPFPEQPRTNVSRQAEDPLRIAQALSGSHARRSSRDEEYEEDHTVLDILYRIGEEQAKQNGYQHKGVECNGCGMQPIRGIRYHCANCWDYDLCESCEAQQIHHKTHVFYKIRIPAPTRGQIKLVQPKWYPGNPNACPESIPSNVKGHLLMTTKLDRQDLDALYEQFKCIAGRTSKEDSDHVGMVIDRPSFDRYFTSTSADRPPVPNLIYDRIFAFYDQNSDGVISFSEFAHSMAQLSHNTSREARIRRLFKAFDLDENGFVDRRDFLYLLRAHYNLNKELAHELVYSRHEAVLSEEEIRDVIQGNNPISAAFGGNIFPGHRSRHGQGKIVDSNGDLVMDADSAEILRPNSQMDGGRAEAIARQASEGLPTIQARHDAREDQPRDESVFGASAARSISVGVNEPSARVGPAMSADRPEPLHNLDVWSNDHITQEDVVEALGTNISLDDIFDAQDRQHVLAAQQDRLWKQLEASNRIVEEAAVHDRWQRRQFYIDEEEGFARPVGYQESDSSEEEEASYVNSEAKVLRSRSSSKVRFDESALDNDVESKSDISSRNTPLNERWGGLAFTQPSRDVGVEIIYEAVQEAFNSMIDHFFKEKEDESLAVKASRKARQHYASELEGYKNRLRRQQESFERALIDADMERTDALFNETSSSNNQVHKDPFSWDQSLPQASEMNEELPSRQRLQNTRDLTLPQFRPNDDAIQPSVLPTSTAAVDESTLAKWHEHEKIEQEAKARGGFARLNLPEFKQKLRNESDIDIGGEGRDDEHYWEEKADLGRFSFMSSWIEMASF